MPSILKSLKLLGDPNRLRLLLLLEREELSVAELQEILNLGQSTISTHLSQLKQAELVEDRRTGKNSIYRLVSPLQTGSTGADFETHRHLIAVLKAARLEITEAADDSRALDLVLRRRQDRMRGYFNELAGRFGKEYVPGRSWKAMAEMMLKLLPPLVVADLGAGEATLSQLLAQRSKQVIAVDNSEKMVEFGQDLARRHGLANLEYRCGDLEALPIADASVDIAFLSQSLHHAPHPKIALGETWRILRPGGRIAILDLRRHNFQEARELYADLWLGFAEVELESFLEAAGFCDSELTVVHRETEAPFFETLLAVATKPALSGKSPQTV
jgi:ubiquinone/menaquinone biosynthesis C-methylase UbiE/DNA-binding transcriptional ArsR family regulator